jgi:hypothetical protein
MGHYAKVINGMVIDVNVATQDWVDAQPDNWAWVQTSYNTSGGVHQLGGEPLRKNYAGIGYRYDTERDAFIPPTPYPSWRLNEDTCLWDPPIPYPTDGKDYLWNEYAQEWTATK